jgi:o-succinylbenzoate synthase
VRIASLEVIPFALPFRAPYVTARGSLSRREMALLRLRDEEGRVGLGEAVPLSMRGGASLAEVIGQLEALGELDALSESAVGAMSGLSAPSRCAALTALMDLRGQRAWSGAPSAPAEPVRCNATLVAGEPHAVSAEAGRWLEEGFTTFKLKLGTGADVRQVAAVREVVGPDARIRVDANGAWDVATATGILGEIEPFDIELVEQPVATIPELAEVARSTPIPIAADESVESREDAERARSAGACRATGVKLSKVGGPEPAVEIAEVLPCYLSSALDGPVGIAAAAQVAATLDQASEGEPELAHGLATRRLFSSTIAAVECELDGDLLRAPPGPGLGVVIDEAALDAHRL